MPTESAPPSGVRGLLKSDIRSGERTLRWFEPAAELAPFVQRLWSSQWNIPKGEYRTQPVLPHPSANLVVMGGSAAIVGVITRSAVQRLEGQGQAFGAKLQPGALRAFGVQSPWLLRDKVTPFSNVFSGVDVGIASLDPHDQAAEIEHHLTSLRPRHDSVSLRAREIVDRLEEDRAMLTVAQLAAAFRLSERSVQAICRRALGVHPKWLIRCFRLQNAAVRLQEGPRLDLASFAQDLGYFDQAHFTRDFKRVTGVSPGRY
jgi:AraC-like DNA-binding protein